MGKESQQITSQEWVVITTPKEAEAAARKIWLDYYRAEVATSGRSPMEQLSPASERRRKEIDEFLDAIPGLLMLHLTVPRANEPPPMARIRNEAEEQVRRERNPKQISLISKGEKLHIRREKAHKRRGTKLGDIH